VIDMSDPALRKLTNVLGPEKATALVTDALRKAGLTSIESPDDRFRLGCELMTRGGLLEAIGRSIKIQAILHGAKEAP
jgi:hypothetical protein